VDAYIPVLDDVRKAAACIAQRVHRTPVLTSQTFDRLTAAQLFFKCEVFQRSGTFKFRGASNAIMCLPADELLHGVVTMSSGNHAAAVALAASMQGIPAHIAMPRNAPEAKKRAVESYGGQITYCADVPSLPETAALLQQKYQAPLIHPFDDPNVIAGQGTAALELLEDVPDLDAIIAPVSGGGLLSGTCIASAEFKPSVRLFGAEPLIADDACRSLRAGTLLSDGVGPTVADGLRATLSERTFRILSSHLEEIVTVTEEQIIQATKLIVERMKILVEPSGAVALAAVLATPQHFSGGSVGVILSGGNLDLDHLPW
jgi:threonine dehydratase